VKRFRVFRAPLAAPGHKLSRHGGTFGISAGRSAQDADEAAARIRALFLRRKSPVAEAPLSSEDHVTA